MSLRATRRFPLRRLAALAGVILLAPCGGRSPSPVEPPGPPPEPVALAPAVAPVAAPAEPAPPPAPAPPPPASLARPNAPPELEIPPYRAIGLGQSVGFGVEVIDPEADVIRVDLIDKPASASYDPLTLTVVWKPTRADLPAGRFRVRITETQRATGKVRTFTHGFAIAVTTARQPHPHAQPLEDAVELLITIHDPERLAQVNRDWPIDKMLLRGAQAELPYLPEDKRQGVGPPNAAALFRGFLKQQAWLHQNPRLDPDAAQFDRATYGNPASWQIITVRPRLDKKWQELRVVYKAMKSPNAVYAMFRYRPVVDKPGLTPELQDLNNQLFSHMVFERLFTKEGALVPAFVKDKKAHGRAVAAMVTDVLDYRSDRHPEAQGYLAAMPNEARLGGGSKRDAAGNYESGDGWAWGVMKPKVSADGKAMEYVMVPIKGWMTKVEATADGAGWKSVCAPRFHPDDPDHSPGYEVLCRKEEGVVDMPELIDGKVAPSKIDAANLHLEYKERDMVAHLALRDPRRDQGEENGMSCAQCHVRNFGVADWYDPTWADAKHGPPTAMNKDLATTFFVIVPTETWRPYGIDFQHKQQCKIKENLRRYLGVEAQLACPLRAESTSK